MLSLLLNWKKPRSDIVISEPDIQAALSHLQSLPFSKTREMPDQWGREWVLQCLREALEQMPNASIKERACIPFGPGLWVKIVPFGIDLAGQPESNELFQAWVLTRPACTDPKAITKL